MARRPDYRLTVNGAAGLTLQGRLISLTLRDNRGFEADQLDLVLDDHDGMLPIPPAGAVIGVHLGWKGEALVDKGQYVVDEIRHSGPPDTLTLRARSADFRATLLEKRTQSWHKVTIGQIVTTIAERHSLTPALTAALAAQTIEHVDQTDESDAHFLTRLAIERDAIATIKGSTTDTPRLLFILAGESRTASGMPMPTVTVHRHDGDRHDYQQARRENRYTGVRAQWYDRATFTASSVTVGEAGEKSGDDRAPDTKQKSLRKIYPSEAEAKRAAWAEWRRLTRAGKRMSITLAEGKAELMSESRVTLVGWKEGIDGADWVAASVQHALSDGGYTTSLELEPLTNLDVGEE